MLADDTEADHEEMLAHEPETREDLRRMKGITKDSPGQPETSGLLTLKDNAKALIRKKCVTYYPINCSAQAIPKYGVKTKDEEQLSQVTYAYTGQGPYLPGRSGLQRKF